MYRNMLQRGFFRKNAQSLITVSERNLQSWFFRVPEKRGEAEFFGKRRSDEAGEVFDEQPKMSRAQFATTKGNWE